MVRILAADHPTRGSIRDGGSSDVERAGRFSSGFEWPSSRIMAERDFSSVFAITARTEIREESVASFVREEWAEQWYRE